MPAMRGQSLLLAALLATLGPSLPEADVERWVRADGTPWCEALVWRHGPINLRAEAFEVIGTTYAPFRNCFVRGGLGYRGTLVGVRYAGMLTSSRGVWSPDLLTIDGSFWLEKNATGDTLRGAFSYGLTTTCGSREALMPVTLVRVAL